MLRSHPMLLFMLLLGIIMILRIKKSAHRIYTSTAASLSLGSSYLTKYNTNFSDVKSKNKKIYYDKKMVDWST